MDVDLTRRAFKKRNLANPLEVARDGEEALEWIGKWDGGAEMPMVILLDLNLPKVHGLEVLRIFKSHPVYKTIPVVVLTTSTENEDLRSAYLIGVNSYIIKPLKFESFVSVTEQIQFYWSDLNKRCSGE
ncbi:MAG: response regulator receiver protein [Fibrobacteres bacterium]|nr:response regulator receiver protein [Fibrobacterota bacterium]